MRCLRGRCRFPPGYQSRMTALFMSATVFARIIGPPVGGLLMQLHGLLVLAGWRRLFIIEGLPAIVLCFVTWRLLTDRPAEATWLRADQRA